MKSKNNYKILPEYQLVIENHAGELTIKNYIKFKKQIINDPLFKPNFKFFIDFNKVIFKITEEDIDSYIKFIDDNIHTLGVRFSAITTNTPNQVVSTTMYKMLQNNRSQTVEIFSTLEAASKWLKIDKKVLEMNIK